MNLARQWNSAQNSGLSRRGFLTTAAAGSAAALGVLGGGGLATANTRAPRQLTTPKGVKGRIGSTVLPFAYQGSKTRMDAASIFDRYVSPAGGAASIQKYFFPESQWLTDPLPLNVTQLPAKYPNFKWVMCFRPSLDLTSADQANLKRSCDLLLEAGIDFDVTLWNEPDGFHQTVFPTASDYQKYFYFYAPYVPSSIDIIYISCCYALPEDQLAFFPAQGRVNKVYYDFYGNVFNAYRFVLDFDPLAPLRQVADDNGLAFGLSEWGFGAAPSDRLNLTPTTIPSAAAFVDYIIKVFSNRLDEGKTNGDLIYFNGRTTVDTQNLITSADDWKVPLYQRLYARLAGSDGAGLNG